MNTTKMTRKARSTKKTFMISHRLLDMLLRYLRSWACAESTFARVSSTFSSIRTVSSPCSCTCTSSAASHPSPPEHVIQWIRYAPYTDHTSSGASSIRICWQCFLQFGLVRKTLLACEILASGTDASDCCCLASDWHPEGATVINAVSAGMHERARLMQL